MQAALADLATGAACGGVGGDSQQWGASPRFEGVPPVPLPKGVLMLFPDYLAGDGAGRGRAPAPSFLQCVFEPLEAAAQ
jgi:hypothetical protein